MKSLKSIRTIMAGTMLAAAGLATLGTGPAMAQAVPDDLTTMPAVPTTFDPPKTAWGDPDLRGTWPIDNIASLPMQRPAQFGDRFWLTEQEFAQRQEQANRSDEAYQAEDENDTIGMGHWVESDASGRRTSLLVEPANGQLPAFTEKAQKLMAASRTSWTPNTEFNWLTDFDSWDRCISRGFPASMFPFRYNNGIRVFQAPGYVVIALEMLGSRVIPIVDKGEGQIPGEIEQWLGHSVGHWEGNQLVIETTNIKTGDSATTDPYARNGSPLNMATMGVPPFNVIPTSKQAKVVERLTMTGPDSIVYEATYSDPEVFTAPWTARLDWSRNDDYQFFEYACHEGNVQPRNYINASRAGREQAEGGESGGSK
ncbi:hypothetical protein FHS61_003037 [Altererythrobacter atlanticus]|uniref:Uncharacterized protein n=1 Tax=Croceibacterium atlanticum TaxID=1267766 RepID=A0A0F7KNW3_9SPHN|nr:hypothetical protein [Croceibacterium atlanticum]AKH42198.1 hypothetical protein WYH_01152 [Croceibacterium atlanticum]MBB5733990.1 hypothetical protein [Croceibacterium atlanticum]